MLLVLIVLFRIYLFDWVGIVVWDFVCLFEDECVLLVGVFDGVEVLLLVEGVMLWEFCV